MNALTTSLSVLGLVVLGAAFSVASAPKVKYAQVKSLLDAKCVKCHNDKRAAEGVNLSSLDAIKKSNAKGTLIVAGKPADSKLITYVDGTKQPRMPFKAAPLSAKEIALLKSWVKSGGN